MTPLLFHVDQEKIDWNQLTEITVEAGAASWENQDTKDSKGKKAGDDLSQPFYSSSACSVMTCKR